MLYRKIQQVINQYFKSYNDYILIIDGARQVGKSFIIRYEGKLSFRNYVELNMMDDKAGKRLFANVRGTEDFYMRLSSVAGMKLGKKNDTLVFIDEIQAYPEMLTLLKFLKDEDRYTYIASGSLLGVTLHKTLSIPGGRINTIQMFPLDFEEFLWANGVGKEAINHIKEQFIQKKSLEDGLHQYIMDLFKNFLLVGGLPQAVNTFVSEQNVIKVRTIHKEIYNLYREDASQYGVMEKLKIRKIYDLIPSNMESRKKRLYFNQIEEKKASAARNYTDEIDYLVSAGIAMEVRAISNPVFPLIASARKNLLKLYFNDVGLLSFIFFKNNIMAIKENQCSVNLGSVYETVVATELAAHGHSLFYYDNKQKGEVDFLIDDYDSLSVLPIEVKSGKDYTMHRAFNRFMSNEDYAVKQAIVFSNERQVYAEEKVIYMPIYMVMFV